MMSTAERKAFKNKLGFGCGCGHDQIISIPLSIYLSGAGRTGDNSSSISGQPKNTLRYGKIQRNV